MTAVSEGAAIFAEAVDWDSDEHERKGTREVIKSDGELGLSFRYESRTPDKKARIAVVLAREIDGFTLKISSLDTGWDSGLVTLRNKEIVTVPLHKRGENKFSVEVFDCGGDAIFIENDTIVITQTYANVGGRFKSGGTAGVTRNVFANSTLSLRLSSTTKNFTARHKSGGFFYLDASRNFCNIGTRQ